MNAECLEHTAIKLTEINNRNSASIEALIEITDRNSQLIERALDLLDKKRKSENDVKTKRVIQFRPMH